MASFKDSILNSFSDMDIREWFIDINFLYDNLDWDQIERELLQSCHFEAGAELLKYQLQLHSHQEILERHNTTHQFSKAYGIQFNDIQKAISQAPSQKSWGQKFKDLKKGKVFELNEINGFIKIVEAYSDLKQTLSNENKKLSENYCPYDEFLIYKKVIRPIRKFINQDGEINYSGHPELKEIFQKIKSSDEKARKTCYEIISRDPFKDVIQFTEYDVVGDRFVIPVRSDRYTSILGYIVARSKSGHTLFVEPNNLAVLNSTRLSYLAKRDEIISRICIELSEVLHQFFESILNIYESLISTDLILAKNIYNEKRELTTPELTQDSYLELKDVFHPLLEDPIKNDLILNPKTLGVLISGPNTGGKSVFLKSVALSHIFTHLGIGVPSKSSRIRPVSKIFFYSDQGQDISKGLSSFASEVTHYLSFVPHLINNSMVIIDEIFNTTSSEEASALAISLIEEMKKTKNIRILVSTHHTLLKDIISKRDDFLSCHVGFNHQTETPTYKINYGSPGPSLALDIFSTIAKSKGLNDEITIRAMEYLKDDRIEYEKLLVKVQQEQNVLDHVVTENKKIQSKLKSDLSAKELIWAKEKEKLIVDFSKELDTIRQSAFSLIEEIKNRENTSKKSVEKDFSKLSKQLPSANKPLSSPTNINYELKELTEGLEYLVTTIGKWGRLKSLNSKKTSAQIDFGNKSIWVPIHHLAGPKSTRTQAQTVVLSVNRERIGKLEYDLRGYRLEDFEQAVMKALDELMSGDIPFLTIIHGHGEGILKSWLRDFLKKEPTFKWSNEEGNDGATRIELS